MIQNEVTDDHLRHFTRVLNGHGAVAGREALHFNNVALLVLERGGHLVESVFGVLAEGALSGAEADFSLRDGLVLIDLADRIFNRGDARVRLLRRLLGLVGAIARVQRVRVGFIGLAHRVADAFGRTSVNVSDHLGVLCGEFIELIHAAANGIQLPVNIFLAGKGIQMSPKTLFARVGERILAGRRLIVALGLGLLRLRLILCGLLILLGDRWHCHGGD